MSLKSKKYFYISALAFATLLAIGALIGVIVLATQKHPCNNDEQIYLSQNFDQQQRVRETMMNAVNKDNIRTNLLTLTKDYHLAGSPANMRAMDFIASTWRSQGLDLVEEERYDILLSYPDYDKPNTICLQQPDGTCSILSAGLSTPLGPPEAKAQQNDTNALLWWNAYSKNGTAIGSIVYVNYCTDNDFETIDNLSISVENKIVLCRYSHGFRGAKTQQAENRNASGVIIYSDPADCGPPSDSDVGVFPNSMYMPKSGAQRGTMIADTYGDAETPFYPSKNYTYRWFDEHELRRQKILPNIPVTPIGFEDAYKIFEAMGKAGGTPIKESSSFVGGLNMTYYFDTKASFELEVNVRTVRNEIKNVIGYIWGKDEPDRQVYLSNHVDAWTYGAMDPNSGTAIHLEVSRMIMTAINETEWRPRRTIVFCAWDAEEYGLGGSSEWVQEKMKTLESRGIAVINVDTGLSGNQTLDVSSAPLLYRSMVAASKFVPNPNLDELNLERKTVFDSWLFYRNLSQIGQDPNIPYMATPSSGSDDASFMMYIGIPSLTFEYDYSTITDQYPLYHSLYEIEWTVENILDRNFTTSAAMARLWGEIVRNLVDSLIIPFNVTDYGFMMTKAVSQLNDHLSNEPDIHFIIDNFDSVMTNLVDCSERFHDATALFQSYVDYGNQGSQVTPSTVEALNSRLTMLERSFVNPRGLPDRPEVRHVVFAPSVYDLYSGSVFSGVTDSLQRYKLATETDDKERLRKMVNLQITVVQYSIESAIQSLNLPKHLAPF